MLKCSPPPPKNIFKITSLILIAGILGACSDSNITPVEEVATMQQVEVSAESNIPSYLVGTEATYPPFEFRNETGGAIGFDVDLLTAIGEKAGFQVKFLNEAWDKWPSSLESGQYDIWSSAIAINEERKNFVTYSDAYLSTYSIIMLLDNEKNRNIYSLADLKNAIISSHAGTVNFEKIKEMKGSEDGIVVENSDFLAVKNLLAGKVDAVIGDVNVLNYYVKDNSKIKIRTFKVDTNDRIDLGFTVKKGRTELADKINLGLEGIKKDGTYQQIYQKWFGDKSN